MFVDEADLIARGGDGGRGACSFRRKAHVPRGGPDGGDGGRGGSVIFVADPQLGTLCDIVHQALYAAENGQPGRGKNMTGRSGRDLVIRLPVGVIVRDTQTGVVLRDLATPGDTLCVAKGGRGGRGNKFFATATNQAPRQYEDGEPGEERRVHLELKLIADVGLVGFPNAGKSTLLSRVSRARPRIAAYPFTTLEPQLGIVTLNEERSFVMADLPGLIEGAHRGVGLGDQFLRHIERTRVICHLVDVSDPAQCSPARRYAAIRRELELYSPLLAAKQEVIAATKMDVPGAPEAAAALSGEIGRPVLAISAATGQGVRELLLELNRILSAQTQEPGQ